MTNHYHVEVTMPDEVTEYGELISKENIQSIVADAAVTVLKHEYIRPPAELTILLTDDKNLRELNRDYLGIDEPTDVLSFPVGEVTPGIPHYMGDIAISLAAVTRQSVAAGHSSKAELQLLTVHAVLHLLGFDHSDENEMTIMWSIQNAILTQLGSDINKDAIIH